MLKEMEMTPFLVNRIMLGDSAVPLDDKSLAPRSKYIHKMRCLKALPPSGRLNVRLRKTALYQIL
ncbi:hypothetical protein HMPREF1640_04995 [Prevotella sp. S7-1-8]|nr:hypothetical protein HMPREF1640_04995 [Prevotella sp. S7-1-8]